MAKRVRAKPLFSLGERTGFVAFAAAVLLGMVDLRLATVPLTLFLMLCAVAPFIPGAGFFFPVVSRGRTGKAVVALTFDDGPDPATTPRLLDLLDRYRLPATFFVTGRRVVRYPELVRMIVSRGHTVGNHSFHHNRYRMFWNPKLLSREIADTQKALSELGVVPLTFRPPVGITTPAMANVLARQRLTTVNFSCRAFDRGNRRINGLAERILSRIRADDIVLLHDAGVVDPARVDRWLVEMQTLLEGIGRKDLTAVSLSRLIGRPVMRRG